MTGRSLASGTCRSPNCIEAVPPGGDCPNPAHQRRRRADTARPNATDRGYGPAFKASRPTVLARDRWCRVCGKHRSTVADHWPVERADLIAAGVSDPDDPKRMRGVCATCHARRGGERKAALGRQSKTSARPRLTHPLDLAAGPSTKSGR